MTTPDPQVHGHVWAQILMATPEQILRLLEDIQSSGSKEQSAR